MLIIKRKETLNDVAIIVLKNIQGKLIVKKQGDFHILKVNNKIVGLNVFNSSKYFQASEGAHILSDLQKKQIEKEGIILDGESSNFSVGKVIEVQQHPKSSKLKLLKVLTKVELKIVTNVLDIEKGVNVVVANVGATLPNGKVIIKNKIMGIESEGMICGSKTLQISDSNSIIKPSGKPGDYFIF